MRVFVAGGSGVIGRRLVPRLVAVKTEDDPLEVRLLFRRQDGRGGGVVGVHPRDVPAGVSPW